jgi:diguanylate cyclase (GGDEF)-like protein/PAS domain S-box-containing protein
MIMTDQRDPTDVFLELTKLLAQSLELMPLLRRILEVTAEYLSVARVSVWLYDPEQQGIQLVDLFDAGQPASLQPVFLRKDCPRYFEAIDNRRVLSVEDVATHAAIQELLQNYLYPLGISSMLDVPIIIEGRMRGVLCHEHTGPKRAWNPPEIGFVASIADLIGQAILTDELRQTREKLRASEERAQMMFFKNPVALLLADEHGRIKAANQRAASLFQTTRHNLETREVDELIPDRLRGEHRLHREGYQDAPAHRDMNSNRQLVARKLDDTEFPAEIGLCPIEIDGSTHVVCAISDISERLRSESRLRVLSAAIEQAPVTMMILDELGRIEYANPCFSQLTGYAESLILGQTLQDLTHGQSSAESFDDIWATLSQGKSWIGELATLTKTGDTLWEEVHVAPVRNEQGKVTHFVAIKLNISHRKQQEAMLRHLALHDQLTDLPNRALLNDRLAMSMQSARRNSHQLALMFIDLDHFKEINDNHGHEVGDEILRASAQRMRAELRGTDTVARIGGDEFVLLIPNISLPRDALNVAEKVRQAIRFPMQTSVMEMHITCSIGIALYPQQASNEIELYRHADQALYRVKAAGRDAAQLY